MYLGIENLLVVANGTLALQVAMQTLGVKGEGVTTPFTFVATASALKWQGLRPRFADIDPAKLTLAPDAVAAAINPRTGVLLPVHVYGTPCDHPALETIAHRNQVKLVYDASHAFGVRSRSGQSLMTLGDAATLSFHATKLFHTVEGGAIAFRTQDQLEEASEIINFGLSKKDPEDISRLGINAKMSEVHAAFGLATLDCIDSIISQRKDILLEYKKRLAKDLIIPVDIDKGNGAYCPVVLPSPTQATNVINALNEVNIQARRYFSPALNETTEYADGSKCPIASDISRRVLCLPIYAGLTLKTINRISETIKKATN